MVANPIIHRFSTDHEWSVAMRDKFLSRFYQQYSLDGRYVFIEKSQCSTLLQKRLAVDTISQSAKDGGSICIEEKIERWPGYQRRNFALETESCTVPGKESPGWMRYAQADYLLYAFAYEGDTGLDIYFIDFQKLRVWFWNVYERYESHIMPETSNHTCFRKVPIKDVVQAVPTTRYLVTSEKCVFIPKRGAA